MDHRDAPDVIELPAASRLASAPQRQPGRALGGPCALALLAALALGLAGCAELKSYRPRLPDAAAPVDCDLQDNAARCRELATEQHRHYTLHLAEFDDQGWPFPRPSGQPDQIDSAIDQIAASLRGSPDCTRVIVFVHGWHHTADYDDRNVVDFRSFLDSVGKQAEAKASSGGDACEDATTARVRAQAAPHTARALALAPPQARRRARIVGIYVGWRGDSFAPDTPLQFASFWDRKATADRVAQGSVRELLSRLSVLSRSALATRAPDGDGAGAQRRLRAYVIGHSFGASVAFRAVSQSLIDGFANGLDAADGLATRFVDMVVLVNPAIEASRFDPLFRTARKLRDYCLRGGGDPSTCDRPPYQAPLLSIFTAESDGATRQLFPIGARLSNLFETEPQPGQQTANRRTIGWDDAFRTHTLALDPAACGADAAASPWVQGPDGQLRYAPPGWRWCIDGKLMTHLGGAAEPAPYNGPLWNVRVTSSNIIDGHNGIWDDDFRDVMLRLFTDEIVHDARAAAR